MVVRTSDIRGAGTDANVTLVITGTLEGQTKDSGPHKLDNSTNNFERAAVGRPLASGSRGHLCSPGGGMLSPVCSSPLAPSGSKQTQTRLLH